MRYYFAPMEGLTDSVFRRLHHKYFGGIDRYYMPFFSPTIHRKLTPKETRELPPALDVPYTAIPQVLTKNAEDLFWAAQLCRDLGYPEINLNAGCPSGTVVAKGKGSGLLRDLDALDSFLDAIFHASPLPISIKTRLGMEQPEEFTAILEIYNRYPIQELILHPRVQKQFYNGSVDKEIFAYAMQNSKNPLCYNGDIKTSAQLQELEACYPGLDAVMLGRGLLADPGFLIGGTDPKALEAFMNELLEEYQILFGSSRNAMFRLKESWSYLYPRFPGSEKLWKRLRKTTDVSEFRAITAEIFGTLTYI